MQIKLNPEKVDLMLSNGSFDILFKSENQIEAIKPYDFGKIHMRLKREKTRYSLKENYYWVANIHYELGVRPNRYFESQKVQDFVKNFVQPYSA
jgi:hypothetical protein